MTPLNIHKISRSKIINLDDISKHFWDYPMIIRDFATPMDTELQLAIGHIRVLIEYGLPVPGRWK